MDMAENTVRDTAEEVHLNADRDPCPGDLVL